MLGSDPKALLRIGCGSGFSGDRLDAPGPVVEALATTSAKRLEMVPEVPTAIEQGINDFDVAAWHGLFGPAKLPDPIRDRIYAAMREALFAPDLKDLLFAQGLIPIGMPPAEFRPWLEQDIAKWREVVRVSGAKAD